MTTAPTDPNTNTNTSTEAVKKVDTAWMAKWKQKKKTAGASSGKAFAFNGGMGKKNVLEAKVNPVSSLEPSTPAASVGWMERWQAQKQKQADPKNKEKEALLAMGASLKASSELPVTERKSLSQWLRMEESPQEEAKERPVVPVMDSGPVAPVGGGHACPLQEEEKGVSHLVESSSVEGMGDSSPLPPVGDRHARPLREEEEVVPKRKSFWRVRSDVLAGEEGIERPKVCLGLAFFFLVFAVIGVLSLFIQKFWLTYHLDQQILLVTTLFALVIAFGFYRMKVWLPPFFLFTFVWGMGKDLLLFYLEITHFSVVGFFVSFVILGVLLFYLVFKRELFKY